MILIEILEFKKWEPLSRTKKLGALTATLEDSELIAIHSDFANYLLFFYKALIQQAIRTQRFPGKYTPLSVPYQRAKAKRGDNPGFWKATGFLERQITYWETNVRSYAIGFPPDLKHPKSGTYLSVIAMANELGSEKRNIPPRPLFLPLAAGISKSIYVHFKKFIRTKYPQHKNLLP